MVALVRRAKYAPAQSTLPDPRAPAWLYNTISHPFQVAVNAKNDLFCGASQFLSTDSNSRGNAECSDESPRLEPGDFLATLQGVPKPGNVPEAGGCRARADTAQVELDLAIQAQAFLPVLRPRLGIPVVLSSQPAIPPPPVPARPGTPGWALAWRHGSATVLFPWGALPMGTTSHRQATNKPITS
jgi:hypothetical protein